MILPLTAFTKATNYQTILYCVVNKTPMPSLHGATFLVPSGCRVCKVPSLQVPGLQGAEVSGIQLGDGRSIFTMLD